MCCLESSLDGFSHGFVVPELVDGVVACDDYFFWPDFLEGDVGSEES